jgi:beta-xylosidase
MWSDSLQIILPAFVLLSTSAAESLPNSTYYNPVIPGWHSDPSCIHVDDTFFCATSSFTAFPGLPVYASKDLINWKHISNAWYRESQLPGINEVSHAQEYGFFAPNLRYHEGTFYMTCVYAGDLDYGILGTIMTTTDIYSGTWSDPVTWNATDGLLIDPDLFWDDDGAVYLTSAGIFQQTINVETGKVSEPVSIWNGTEDIYPEGPHIYKKDGWYYLMIAEGGTQLGHMVNIARSRHPGGPYKSNPANPVLTAANTSSYFQAVGHADLFQDSDGNWWGMAHGDRSGPEFVNFPMGREAVLFPVTWPKGGWPVASPVEGVMNGWPLPCWNRDITGDGRWSGESVLETFSKGSNMPIDFVFWRYPLANGFKISPPGHPNQLQVRPTLANLTGDQSEGASDALSGIDGLGFVGRRQEHTFFSFSVDLEFHPQSAGQEAGLTVFYTQAQHIDIGMSCASGSWEFVLRSTNRTSSTTSITAPSTFLGVDVITLQVDAANSTTYRFSAWPTENPNARILVGYASVEIVTNEVENSSSATLLGVFATCNGVSRKKQCPPGGNAYFANWRYDGLAQEVTESVYVP